MTPEPSQQSGQNLTVGDDYGRNQRQTAAAYQRPQNPVRLRLKLAASIFAFVASFGVALASGTPQREPSPLEQGTVGPLHLGMTVLQVRNILGPAVLHPKGADDWSDTYLDYTDGAYDLQITFERPASEKTFKGSESGSGDGIFIRMRRRFEDPDPSIPRSLMPIMSWKWLGKPLSYPPRDRHPIGFTYNYSTDWFDDFDEQKVPTLNLHSRYVYIHFEAWGWPDHSIQLSRVRPASAYSRENLNDNGP